MLLVRSFILGILWRYWFGKDKEDDKNLFSFHTSRNHFQQWYGLKSNVLWTVVKVWWNCGGYINYIELGTAIKKRSWQKVTKPFPHFLKTPILFINLIQSLCIGSSWYREHYNNLLEILFRKYFNGVMLEIYLDHKFQWPQERLIYAFLAYQVIT